MLNIIISDSAKASMMRLANMVKAISKENQLDADIKLLTFGVKNVFGVPVDESATYLFILEFHTEELHLYKKINDTYADSYILFFSETINEDVLKASLEGNIRPSGFIKKPVNIRELHENFMDIYACYLNRIQDEAVHVSAEGRMYIIPLKEIIYFESINKKVNLVTKNRCVSYYTNLYGLEEDYAELLMRCHKSYLANIQRINTAMFDEMLLLMDNGAKLPISRTYKNSVKLRLTPKK